MIIDGQEVSINDWSPDWASEWVPRIKERGYLAFEGMEDTSVQSGDPVMGYRIFYKAPDGKLYPPVMHKDNLIKADEGQYPKFKKPSEAGIVNHSVSEEGFFYWHDRTLAEAYLFTILADNKHKHRNDQGALPKGQFVIHRVEGVAKTNTIGQAGDVMEDMYIPQEEPLISVRYTELFQK